jgi:PIN domain nuclease of toxin-antitoxin system
MRDAVTDTHGLIWYLEDSPRLGSGARTAFDACERSPFTFPRFAW